MEDPGLGFRVPVTHWEELEFDSILCWRALLQEFSGSDIRPEIVSALPPCLQSQRIPKVHVLQDLLNLNSESLPDEPNALWHSNPPDEQSDVDSGVPNMVARHLRTQSIMMASLLRTLMYVLIWLRVGLRKPVAKGFRV